MARQENWRFCNRCHGLWWADGGAGPCFDDRLHPPHPGNFDTRGHNAAVSWNFELVSSDESSTGQPNWKFCNKCKGLWWAGDGMGKCPGGDGHDGARSWNFILAPVGSGVTGQDNWRYCNKCHALWWAGNGRGACIDNHGHDDARSWDFVLPVRPEPPEPPGPVVK